VNYSFKGIVQQANNNNKKEKDNILKKVGDPTVDKPLTSN